MSDWPLELARPWALGLLLAPLVLLLLARRPGRPRPIATGTLEIWRAVAAQHAPARGARPRIPPSVWWLAAALALGALALSGPSARRVPPAHAWTFLVDQSPSMFLAAGRERFDGPFDAEGLLDAAQRGGPTRYELALGRAVELAREFEARGDRVRWSAQAAGRERVFEGAQVPGELARAGPFVRDGPDWARRDLAGFVWVTDREPVAPRTRAGLVASGGPAVPGPIAALGTTRLDWDGEGWVEVPGGAPRLALHVDPRLPAELRELGAFYAQARGLELGGAGPTALVLEVHGEGPDVAVAAAREGFGLVGRAAASGVPLGADGPEPWLRSGSPAELVLVAFEPGRVSVALRALERFTGDPAAFPVAFAALLDGSALAPPGVVALAERLAAGPARFERPAAPPPEQGPGDEPPWIAVLVAAALLLALVATFVRAREVRPLGASGRQPARGRAGAAP